MTSEPLDTPQAPVPANQPPVTPKPPTSPPANWQPLGAVRDYLTVLMDQDDYWERERRR